MVSKALHDGGFGACSRSFSFPMFYAEVRKHSQGQHDFAAQCDCCRCSNVRQKVVQPVRQRHLEQQTCGEIYVRSDPLCGCTPVKKPIRVCQTAKIAGVQFTAVTAAADQLNFLFRQQQAELLQVILSTKRLTVVALLVPDA